MKGIIFGFSDGIHVLYLIFFSPSPNPRPFENQDDDALHNLQDLSDVYVFDFSEYRVLFLKF